MTNLTKKLQAAVLSLSLFIPASGAFAVTHVHHTTHVVRHHHKSHSRTRGTAVGAGWPA